MSASTWAKYDAHLRNHILPRFGELGLGEVSRLAVKGWVKTLRRSLAEATVIDVVSLLSTIFNEAVDEELIAANPCRRLRLRGGEENERPVATAAQVTEFAARASFLDGMMIITAAYTGMRWGELAGLQWSQVNLAAGSLEVDATVGALHEVNAILKLGPPKTKTSARTVHLPPFLVELLVEAGESERRGRFVFTAPEGGWHRRANFRRRVWLPPITPGLHFHDLRHTQKTWMIEDGVPDVLQRKRLGHKVRDTAGRYSHVTQPMVDHMLGGLQRRWEQFGSTILGDHYRDPGVVKISCSQSAPTTQKRPVGDDHQQAV